MISKNEITINQIIFIFLLSIGLVNHVQMIPLLLNTSRKDSWMAVLIALPICILIVCVVGFLLKKVNKLHFLVWIERKSNRFVACVVGIIFWCIFLLNSYLTSRGVIEWTQVTYLKKTPIFVTTLVLLGLVVYLVQKGLRTIGIVAGVLLPFVVLAGYFVMTANFQFKDYQLLRPFLTTSITEISWTTLYVLSSTIELISVLFIQHRANHRIKTKHLILLSFFLISLTIGPLMGSVAAFGLFSQTMRYPAFEQWLLVQLGDYISNVDFLSIYQWLSGAFVRLAFELYLMGEIFAYVFKVKKLIYFYLVMTLILIGFTAFPVIIVMDVISFYEVYMPTLFIIYIVMIILFTLLTFVTKSKGRESM
ncbi:hypothetical protein AJ85_00105 [Alkalihalobacillus alcalophilus ATCC 27647 = CGMCC 1.3604]|nr:endospore germination permease [Alkalihalobacillus alcalophilus]KGA98679.1 hypothetical protein BALCAV_0202705 [Alkalihalobacillus alcalophilus ATCC 27647 = CGMCC 1.3604]MED1560304.1 endospore germination permease [Alkalihalobacillus alcalophilus]THG88763.1 hypothetical protein AJ85_00105 [Alkalihalobacillus alcalophilus ATCC 27647 = CGMCC 1.3604]